VREALEEEKEMTTESQAELVLAVTRRLRDEADGEHPESVQVKGELARMFIESQSIIAELRAKVAELAPYSQVSP